MNHLSVTNFIAIASAEIDLAPTITMLAGDNETGKSSTIMGAQIATTGRIIPIEGLPKGSAGRLVHSGGAAGEIRLATDGGASTTTYPEAKRETTGAPLEISATAAGMESLVDLPVKERAVAVSAMLRAEPTADAMGAALVTAKIQAATIKSTLQTVAVSGWDAAHKACAEAGARLKGAWQQVTGEQYASSKAPSWAPKEWTADLNDKTEAVLAAELKQENEWLEAAISDNAVQSSEIAALSETAQGIVAAKSAVESLTIEIDGLKKTGKLMQEGLAKLPAAEQPISQPCPHCAGLVTISGVKVVKVVALTDAELAARREIIEATKADIQKTADYLRVKQGELITAQSKYQECQRATDKLSRLNAQKQSAGEHKSIDDCRLRVKTAETRLLAWQRRTQASAKASEIADNQILVDILAPNGMRLNSLTEKLAAFNDTLIKVCELAGWRHAALRADMAVSWGGVPYMLCSRAAKWKVKTALQIATTIIDRSKLLIIDDVDIMASPKDRNNFMKLLLSLGIQVIIGIAIAERGKVPDMSKVNGAAYWIEAGVAEKIV